MKMDDKLTKRQQALMDCVTKESVGDWQVELTNTRLHRQRVLTRKLIRLNDYASMKLIGEHYSVNIDEIEEGAL